MAFRLGIYSSAGRSTYLANMKPWLHYPAPHKISVIVYACNHRIWVQAESGIPGHPQYIMNLSLRDSDFKKMNGTHTISWHTECLPRMQARNCNTSLKAPLSTFRTFPLFNSGSFSLIFVSVKSYFLITQLKTHVPSQARIIFIDYFTLNLKTMLACQYHTWT